MMSGTVSATTEPPAVAEPDDVGKAGGGAAMRVLHLLDGRGPGGEGTALALLADGIGRTPGFEQQILQLGRVGLAERAAALHLPAPARLSPPCGLPLLGWRGLRNFLRITPGIELIHTWSPATLTLATLASPDLPRALTLTRPPEGPVVRWLRMLLEERWGSRTVVLATSATVRRRLVEGGCPDSSVHVLRPAIHMGRIDPHARAALRERWGAGEDDRIVALLSDPPEAADAREAILSVGLADESRSTAGKRLRLLLHPRQVGMLRACESVRALGAVSRIIVARKVDCPWAVLPGCDLALAPGPAAKGLSLPWAMASNVPIVAEATYAISEILEARHSALLAPPGRRDHLVRQMLRMLGDERLRWQLRDTARHEAYSFFSRQQYSRHLTTVYQQMVSGEPIEVPPLQVTGGLRFAGRA